MGQGQGTAAYSELGGKLLGMAVQHQTGRAARAYRFKVSPSYAPAHASAKRLCGGFLRRKARGQALLRCALGGAVAAFAFGKDAVKEAVAEAHDRLANTLDFYHVDSQAKHHSLMLSQRLGLVAQNGSVREIRKKVPHEIARLDDEGLMKNTRKAQIAEDWNLVLVATSKGMPKPLLDLLCGGINACGGQVLTHGTVSEHCADIDFEFGRRSSMEMYSLLVSAGLALSLEAHHRLTELCQCSLLADSREASARVRVHLSVYAGEGAESFLADTFGPVREAA